ncbi:MAG: diacylglycerol/lipid kinase family protein [Alphaproteobacteria bacterium]
MPFLVLVNRNSGRILKEGRKVFAARLLEAMGNELGIIEFFSPRHLEIALRKFNGSGKLLIAGGDGTIASAASILGQKKIPFGILPLGTMNLFAKDLDLPVDPYECAARYKNHEMRSIDMASVNDRVFLCNVMLGAGVSIARQREAERETKSILKWIRLGRALIKKLGSPKLYKFSFHYEGQKVKEEIKSAVVSNNKYMAEPGLQNSLKKASLTHGKLSIYTVHTQGTLQSLTLLAKLALGFWQNDPAIENFDTPQLKVTNGHGIISILVDGEPVRMSTPLMFKIEPLALELIVPVPVPEIIE